MQQPSTSARLGPWRCRRWWLLVVFLLCATPGFDPLHAASVTSKRTTISDVMGSRVVYLGEHLFTNGGGSFSMSLDVAITVGRSGSDHGEYFRLDDNVWQSVTQRTLLHFVACDHHVVSFLSSYENEWIPRDLPGYCALANHQTMQDLCFSVALTNNLTVETTASRIAYRVQQTINKSLDATLEATGSNLVFFVDACETVGGKYGVLRSCLASSNATDLRNTNNEPGGSQQAPPSTTCFHCSLMDRDDLMNTSLSPASNKECIEPPYLDRVRYQVSYQITTQDEPVHTVVITTPVPHFGDSEFKRDSLLAVLYFVLTCAWTTMLLVWKRHLDFPSSHNKQLQRRMALVPIVQMVYSVASCFGYRYWPILDTVVTCVTGLARCIAIARTMELVLLIAKGWQITQVTVQRQEFGVGKYFLTWMYALCLVIITYDPRNSGLILPTWVLCWFAVVFFAAVDCLQNKKMLTHQIELIHQMGVDPWSTPVWTKLTLFEFFGVLVSMYFVLTALLLLLRTVPEIFMLHKHFILFVDESLTVVFCGAMGVLFRCRNFHHAFDSIENLREPAQIQVVLISNRQQSEPETSSTEMHLPPPQDHEQDQSQDQVPIGSTRRHPTSAQYQVIPQLSPDHARPTSQPASTVVIVNPDQEAVLGLPCGMSSDKQL